MGRPDETKNARRHEGSDWTNQVEGYLLWQTRVQDAKCLARAFTEAFDWLTTSQRVEIERRYIGDRLQCEEQDLRRIVQRAADLRSEYEQRYRRLRLRCTAVTVSAVTAAVAALVVAVSYLP
ncbi:cytochrome C oxidase subunit I [Streptomyces shenzhenensis]|uniref:cytochrome C oxidase subunit I n=1 Tax=Streptomyces shenzhenensis TaxID=943815 RepID=UPI003D8EE8D4